LLPATQIQIHSDLFPKPIQAKVISVDVHQRTAVLSQFTFLKRDPEARKETRVQPKRRLNARIIVGGPENKSGRINDISVEGISLIFPASEADFVQICLSGTSVRIEYHLPVASQKEDVNISIPAKVTYKNVTSMEEGIIGFQTFPKEPERDVLRRFIFDCQTEIFNEIDLDS
jgi:hypothetical protein